MPQDESKIDPELAEFVQKFLDTMFAGKECPHCHTPLERKEQIGGCVYGVPCRADAGCITAALIYTDWSSAIILAVLNQPASTAA